MLTIRSQQVAVFSEADAREFVEWMLAHLKRFFPRQCAAAGEIQLRETVRYGIGRSATYGFTEKSEVCQYIDLMVVFGRDFDIDKRLAWAGEILGKKMHPVRKMKALHEAARKHLRRS